MKNLLSIALLLPLVAFAQVAPYVKNPFSTNATPAASSVFTPAISDETGTGVFVLSSDAKMTNAILVTPKITNNAAAGSVATSDASGNIGWSNTVSGNISGNGSGLTNINWPDLNKGFYLSFAVTEASSSYTIGTPAFTKTAAIGSNQRAGTSTNLPYWEPFTDTVSNRNFNMSLTPQLFSSNWRLALISQNSISNITTYAYFCGFTDRTPAQQQAATNYVGDMVGLTYNTLLGHTNYMIVTGNGTTSTLINTGWGATNQIPITLQLQGDTTGTNFDFWINGNFIARATNTTPRAGTLMYPTWCGGNLQTNVRHGRINYIGVKAQGPAQ